MSTFISSNGALLALVGVIFSTVIGLIIALRKSRSDSATAGYAQSFDMMKYVREQVEKAVKDETQELRDKVEALERLVESLHGRYSLLLGGFKKYIADAAAQLGSGGPKIDVRVQRLLSDRGDDTSTAQQFADLRESIAREDDNSDQERY